MNTHVIMGTSGHKSVQSLISYNRPLEQAKASTAAKLDIPLFASRQSFVPSGGLSSVRDTVSEGRIQELSQVASIKLLFSKLGGKTTRVFQMAKKTYTKEGEWYTGCPLGKNTTSATMKWLSEKAGLSRVYTNHCVRATCVQTELGVNTHVIMGTSGHKSVQSLISYNRPLEQAKASTVAKLDIPLFASRQSFVPSGTLGRRLR